MSGFARFGRHFGAAAILALVVFPSHSIQPEQIPAGAGDAITLQQEQLIDLLAREIAIQGLVKKYEQSGCLELADRAVCLKPGATPEQIEWAIRNLPSYAFDQRRSDKFERDGRWSFTTIDGATGGVGDPITLTWSIVPDGTPADGVPSVLVSTLNGLFGGNSWENDLAVAIENRWGNKIGVTYIRDPAVGYDDGASLPGTAGALGVRGDVRISGRFVDGGGAGGPVLAYNYFPGGGGDMVMDTSEGAFWTGGINNSNIRNTVSHEHGHGLGLGHVSAPNSSQLMEPFFQPTPAGPQDDDVRGGMKNYGDVYEDNDVAGDATDLGLIGSFTGTDPETTFIRWNSLDRPSDEDWYKFTSPGARELRVEIDPDGATYLIGPDGGPTSTVSTDSIIDLLFDVYESDGTTLLTTVDDGGVGVTEILTGYPLPIAGDYLLRIGKAPNSDPGIQLYKMTIILTPSASDVPLAGEISPQELALSVHPNPVRADTRAAFRAPSAGPVALEVFDTSGRSVRRIERNAPSAGLVEIPWSGADADGRELGSGVYFLRVSAGTLTETQRAVLIR